MDEVTGGWRKWHILRHVLHRAPFYVLYLKKSCMVSNPCHILLGRSNDEDEMGVALGKREMHTRVS